MKHLKSLRPSPALIVAMVALVAAMSGAAVALPDKNTVDSGDIEDKTVKGKDVKDGSIGSRQIKGRAVKGSDVEDDSLKGRQVFEDKLEAVPVAKAVQTVSPFGDSFERVAATDGVDTGTARGSAPTVPLAAKGQLSVYGKCFRNTTTNTVFAAAFIATSGNGAVFESGPNQLEGTDGFLNPATVEADRVLLEASTDAPGAVLDTGTWFAMAPDGTGFGGEVAVAAKNGALAGGNGVYGDGNVCLFGGNAIG